MAFISSCCEPMGIVAATELQLIRDVSSTSREGGPDTKHFPPALVTPVHRHPRELASTCTKFFPRSACSMILNEEQVRAICSIWACRHICVQDERTLKTQHVAPGTWYYEAAKECSSERQATSVVTVVTSNSRQHASLCRLSSHVRFHRALETTSGWLAGLKPCRCCMVPLARSVCRKYERVEMEKHVRSRGGRYQQAADRTASESWETRT